MNNFYYLSSPIMPPATSIAYTVLKILSDGQKHTTTELTKLLSRSPRSALQRLSNDKHGYWLIHNLGKHQGEYQLDKRHLLESRKADREARAERRLSFRKKSLKLAVTESRRVPKAIMLKKKAQEEHQMTLDLSPALAATNETKLDVNKGQANGN